MSIVSFPRRSDLFVMTASRHIFAGEHLQVLGRCLQEGEIITVIEDTERSFQFSMVVLSMIMTEAGEIAYIAGDDNNINACMRRL